MEVAIAAGRFDRDDLDPVSLRSYVRQQRQRTCGCTDNYLGIDFPSLGMKLMYIRESLEAFRDDRETSRVISEIE